MKVIVTLAQLEETISKPHLTMYEKYKLNQKLKYMRANNLEEMEIDPNNLNK